MNNRTWGQQCCRGTPDTLSKAIRVGELQHGGVREGIWESVVDLQRSQP